jgi:phosphosulfolactate phosphohydrolase-like enzyme
MFRESNHAAGLAKLGFGVDLAFCARRDVFDVVPTLERTPEGLLRIVARRGGR